VSRLSPADAITFKAVDNSGLNRLHVVAVSELDRGFAAADKCLAPPFQVDSIAFLKLGKQLVTPASVLSDHQPYFHLVRVARVREHKTMPLMEEEPPILYRVATCISRYQTWVLSFQYETAKRIIWVHSGKHKRLHRIENAFIRTALSNSRTLSRHALLVGSAQSHQPGRAQHNVIVCFDCMVSLALVSFLNVV